VAPNREHNGIPHPHECASNVDACPDCDSCGHEECCRSSTRTGWRGDTAARSPHPAQYRRSIRRLWRITVQVPDGSGVYTGEIAFDETTGFTALMKIFKHMVASDVAARQIRAPIVALSTPDPMLGMPTGTVLVPTVFVRNTTSSSMPFRLTVSWSSAQAHGSYPVLSDSLAPGEARRIDLSSIQQQKAIPPESRWATVSIDFTGREFDVIAVNSSYDSAGKFGPIPVLQHPRGAMESRCMES
jgi:hypothetical protein